MAENRNFEGELTKAISHSLDFHKIIVMAIAIAIATVALHFFVWVGGKISGKYVQLFTYLISGIGWVVGAVAVLSAMVAVSKMAAAKDAGEKKSFIAGIGLCASTVLTVIFANLRYLIWLALGIAVMWIFGWLGLIPKGGPIIWGIIGIIAVLVGLYVAFFVVAKFFLNTLILPGIIAQGGKAIQCFKESKRIINGHTIRLIKRFLSIGLVIVIFVFVTCEAWRFVYSKTEDTMADNTRAALSGGPPMKVPPVVPSYQYLPIVDDSVNLGKALPGNTKGAGAWIFGILMIVLLLGLQSIPAIFYAVAGMYTYQALKGEPETPISGPEVPVDLSKLKGSLDAMGAKFREEMKEDEGAKKTGSKSG
jgi:MFS family permease